jgi:hypothetical protein
MDISRIRPETLLSTGNMANLVFYDFAKRTMNTPSLIYLDNRADFYSTLLPSIVSEIFAAELERAISPLRESDGLVHSIQLMHGLESLPGYPEALLLDDLLKKPGYGHQLAKITTSIREALRNSERIELIGYSWFQALSKQELIDFTSLETMASSRKRCFMNILKLRDELDFHRLRLL